MTSEIFRVMLTVLHGPTIPFLRWLLNAFTWQNVQWGVFEPNISPVKRFTSFAKNSLSQPMTLPLLHTFLFAPAILRQMGKPLLALPINFTLPVNRPFQFCRVKNTPDAAAFLSDAMRNQNLDPGSKLRQSLCCTVCSGNNLIFRLPLCPQWYSKTKSYAFLHVS